MAFPTSHSHPDGTGNPALTWWRGPVSVLTQTESRAKPDRERDRIPLGLAAVSTARLRPIAIETGNNSLRESEVRTLTDLGKFRVVPEDDLACFGYQGNYTQMESDIRSLSRQGLVEPRTIEGHAREHSVITTACLASDGTYE
jgi:hypothetical protein